MPGRSVKPSIRRHYVQALLRVGPMNCGYPNVSVWTVPYWANLPNVRMVEPGGALLTFPNSSVHFEPFTTLVQYG